MKLGKTGLVSLIVAASIISDQLTKLLARHFLADKGTLSYLGDTVRLVLIENQGAFLGMGSSLPPMARTLIFVAMVGLFILGVTIWLFRAPGLSTATIVSAAFLIGGGIGNLIDRVLFSGGVTDFMNVGIGPLRTGIFNVADLWIVGAVIALLFSKDLRQGPQEN